VTDFTTLSAQDWLHCAFKNDVAV